MAPLNTLKDHFLEAKLFMNRTICAASMVCLLVMILLGRLFYLQFIRFEHFQALSRHNQIRMIPIPPPRGLIYDRQGQLLAENIPAFSLEITPARAKDLKKTIENLKSVITLSPHEIQAFQRQVRFKNPSDPIPIRFKLTEAEVAQFSLEKYRFPGVDIGARLIRHYPQKELYAHLIGYVGPINEKELKSLDRTNYRGSYHTGKVGLERFYENTLHGQVGFQQVETDARGRINRVLEKTAPQEGADLHLSLDSRLQKIAFEALGQERGAVIAIVPKTGEVRALVSKPSYDPNWFAQGIPFKLYANLQNSQDQPLFDRALRGQYPPASVIKPMIALQGLERGAVNTSFQIFDPGWYQLNQEGRLYRDWNRYGHGWTDLDKAISHSCDTFFWQLAIKLGITQLHDIFAKFGLGQTTGIDLSGELSGLIPSKEWKWRQKKEKWYPGETLNIGIGQGDILSTPLQLAHMTTIIANRGLRFRPRVVSMIDSPDRGPVDQAIEQLPSIEIKKPYWEVVITAMKKVIHSPGGTAYRIGRDLNYEVAAKTGTAQVFSLKQNQRYESDKLKSHLRDHGWFIAFAPASNPEIAIAVLVENNSKLSKEASRLILDAFFDLKKLDAGLETPLPQAQGS